MYAILLRGEVAYGYIETTEEAAAEFQCDYVLVDDLPQAFIDLPVGYYVKYDLTSNQFSLASANGNGLTLQEVKIAELNAACNAAILAGFTSNALGTDNSYDFDYDAQINLGGMLNAITAGLVTGTVMWKTSGVPQAHTVDQFKVVFAAGLTHKNTNIEHYWTLKAAVLAATSDEEIRAIVW